MNDDSMIGCVVVKDSKALFRGRIGYRESVTVGLPMSDKRKDAMFKPIKERDMDQTGESNVIRLGMIKRRKY